MAHVPQMPRPDDDGSRSPPLAPAALRHDPSRQGAAAAREPAVMVPGAIIATLVVLVGIQLVRGQLDWRTDLDLLGLFAFVPARYRDAFGMFPGGIAAAGWTFVTYALLHGSWMHLVTNGLWLVAFGSAVARRFGPIRFFAFATVAAAAGAGVHLALHFGEPVPVVGASAAIAGMMAAASRFVFDSAGRLTVGPGNDNAAFRRPARPLAETLRNPRSLLFVLVFIGLNLLTGVGSTLAGGLSIAWEAHIGGFLVGLFLFRSFDPVPRGADRYAD